MPEFFVVLKKRIGLGGAIMLFGIFRIGPFVLVAAIVPLVLLGEWLNAVMCFFLGFALLGTGLLMQVYLRNVLAREERQAQKSSTAANEAAATIAAAEGGIPTCAMPECKRNVEVPKHPLCPECWTDWKDRQTGNTLDCATPGCENTATSLNHPLCRLCWGKWDKENRR